MKRNEAAEALLSTWDDCPFCGEKVLPAIPDKKRRAYCMNCGASENHMNAMRQLCDQLEKARVIIAALSIIVASEWNIPEYRNRDTVMDIDEAQERADAWLTANPEHPGQPDSPAGAGGKDGANE